MKNPYYWQKVTVPSVYFPVYTSNTGATAAWRRIRITRMAVSGATVCTISVASTSSPLASHGEAEPARLASTRSRAASRTRRQTEALLTTRVTHLRPTHSRQHVLEITSTPGDEERQRSLWEKLVDEDRPQPLLVPLPAPAPVEDEQAVHLGRGKGVDDVGGVALSEPGPQRARSSE